MLLYATVPSSQLRHALLLPTPIFASSLSIDNFPALEEASKESKWVRHSDPEGQRHTVRCSSAAPLVAQHTHGGANRKARRSRVDRRPRSYQNLPSHPVQQPFPQQAETLKPRKVVVVNRKSQESRASVPSRRPSSTRSRPDASRVQDDVGWHDHAPKCCNCTHWNSPAHANRPYSRVAAAAAAASYRSRSTVPKYGSTVRQHWLH